MDPHAMQDILCETEDKCWRCGSEYLRPVQFDLIGAIVICDYCGHEHYFTKAIPDVPTHLD